MSASRHIETVREGIGIGHKVAPEIWDEAVGHYLLQTNEDGTYKCADGCEPCAALAALAELETQQRETGERIAQAGELLDECLWDEERAWEPNELVERMEAVYVALGGVIDPAVRFAAVSSPVSPKETTP